MALWTKAVDTGIEKAVAKSALAGKYRISVNQRNPQLKILFVFLWQKRSDICVYDGIPILYNMFISLQYQRNRRTLQSSHA